MKPKPLFVGDRDQTHECVVRSFMDTLPGFPDDRAEYYRKGDHWGDWIINDQPYRVTLVVVEGGWAFAVFADGPEFGV